MTDIAAIRARVQRIRDGWHGTAEMDRADLFAYIDVLEAERDTAEQHIREVDAVCQGLRERLADCEEVRDGS